MSFVPTEVHFVPTKYRKKLQFFNVKMQKISKLARIYTDCLNVSVFSAYCRYIIVPYTRSNERKLY